jgi:hypothetical protein
MSDHDPTGHPLPLGIACCPGVGFKEEDGWDWREGCEDCLRRTAPGGGQWMEPPPIIVFACENRIGPGKGPVA